MSMPDDDEFVLASVSFGAISTVLFSAVLAGLACAWPNNTALYLSVLVWPAGLLAIISVIITAISTCKNGVKLAIKGFVAWWVLAILSSGFTVAAIAVLDVAAGLADNPHLIWN
jgi:hypothetical protein